jgi:hypothetical protein
MCSEWAAVRDAGLLAYLQLAVIMSKLPCSSSTAGKALALLMYDRHLDITGTLVTVVLSDMRVPTPSLIREGPGSSRHRPG